MARPRIVLGADDERGGRLFGLAVRCSRWGGIEDDECGGERLGLADGCSAWGGIFCWMSSPLVSSSTKGDESREVRYG